MQGGVKMNYPKTKDGLDKKVKEVKQKIEEFLNRGVIGRDSTKLQETLEFHERIKILLDELEYILQKDIPVEDVLTKISSIEREIDVIRKEAEK